MHNCFQFMGSPAATQRILWPLSRKLFPLAGRPVTRFRGVCKNPTVSRYFTTVGKTALYGIPALFYPGRVTGSRTKGLSFWRAEIINGP